MLLIENLRRNMPSTEWLMSDHSREYLIDALDMSMIFQINDDVCQASRRIADGKTSCLVKAVPLIRMPYKYTWIEFFAKDRLLDGKEREKWEKLEWPARKIGFLSECIDKTYQRGFLNMFFDTGVDEMHSNYWCLFYDFSNDPVAQIVDPIRAERMSFARQYDIEHTLPMLKSEKLSESEQFEEIRSRRELQKRVITCESQFADKFLGSITDDEKDECATNMTALWGTEPQFLMAIIAFLNSQNSVHFSTVDRSKINKKRIKRGKLPFYSHKTVHLKLTKTQKFRTRHMTGEEKRAHLVRGHFKVRKTGVFWWMPHIRGNMNLGFVDKDYELSA